jgi:hypothetical protein
MGIEPTREMLQNPEDTRFRIKPLLKCGWRVNFRGTWGHIGIREQVERLTSLWRSDCQ